ncbi:uncharacterized protein EKO05_0005981 [Ascochyta rabiei]|uniref:Uncharacterized protein n=1 Tax=Didymella rabiei TaxID=5454 RepID=A0A163M8L3_DIDRA|nr:uncharacterized protein EKO05_0005981 [Ascochyta rabiei]KZM28495.1 hypothetical protein ST47_g348 [Ascochyta rabiei]UPX15537.1 hypothetical protein EKO05_0005981 [Ascochyta rabiei]
MPTTRAPTRLSNPAHTTNISNVMLDERGFNWGPWTISERRVVYEYLNSWISEHGLDAFVSKTWTQSELEFVADTINQVNAADGEENAPRSVLGVQRQIRQLHRGRLGPLAKLARRSGALKFKLEGEGEGELDHVVLHKERFPNMAVPVPTLVDGTYVVGDQGSVSVRTVQGEISSVKDSNVAREGKGAREEVGSEMGASEATTAQTEKEEMVVKLSVDWARLYVQKDGEMVIQEEGEVCEMPPTS